MKDKPPARTPPKQAACFKLKLLHSVEDPLDDNIDALVHLEDGSVYGVTFFTQRNILTLMERWKQSGECLNGAYFWSIDAIIVDKIEQSHLERIIDDFLCDNEQGFRKYFTKVADSAQELCEVSEP